MSNSLPVRMQLNKKPVKFKLNDHFFTCGKTVVSKVGKLLLTIHIITFSIYISSML